MSEDPEKVEDIFKDVPQGSRDPNITREQLIEMMNGRGERVPRKPKTILGMPKRKLFMYVGAGMAVVVVVAVLFG